jgi:hypothetical protein
MEFRHYNQYLLSAAHSKLVPQFTLQTVEVPCCHCGQHTRIAVREDCIDWKTVADDYRSAMEHMTERMERMILDIDAMQTWPNPVREYLANEWRILLQQVARRMMDPSSPLSELSGRLHDFIEKRIASLSHPTPTATYDSSTPPKG